MLETAQAGLTVDKARHSRELPALRSRMLEIQRAVRAANRPVLIMVSGAEGAGKGEFVHRLNEWLDPRGVETHAFWDLSDEERERPRFWRFWRALPARGRIAVLFGSWYTEPIIRRVQGGLKQAAFETRLEQIATFEQMLARDGAIIIKLWFHLSKKEQRKALDKLENDQQVAARMLPSDWEHLKLYRRFFKASAHALDRTNARHAPWQVIAAADRRHRELAAGKAILRAIEGALARPSRAAVSSAARSLPARAPKVPLLSQVDLEQRLTDEEYKSQLEKWQARLAKLCWAARAKEIPSVFLFEGWDASGKGGAIRRVTAAMDPRLYRTVSIAAPSEEELAHHYLWRFWRHLPRAGRTTLFDRSWYGRVLVERVEGFAPIEAWSRAYAEINDFERQMTGHGVVLAKFWIHISKQEQLRRFHEREKTAFKRHKITPDDWRNRRRWDDYTQAIDDMAALTSTPAAPWILIPGNDKKFARVEILKTLCGRLSEAL